VCIEALSITLDVPKLKAAVQNLNSLGAQVGSLKEKDKQRLQDEYKRLVEVCALAQVFLACGPHIGPAPVV
jgi:hypothetical protein